MLLPSAVSLMYFMLIESVLALGNLKAVPKVPSPLALAAARYCRLKANACVTAYDMGYSFRNSMTQTRQNTLRSKRHPSKEDRAYRVVPAGKESETHLEPADRPTGYRCG